MSHQSESIDLQPQSPDAAMSPVIALVFLIGVPGSGKSTWAAAFQKNHTCQLISTDRIRAELFGDEAIQGDWGLIWAAVQQQFQPAIQQIRAGEIEVALYDATNTKRRYRRDLIQMARSSGFNHIRGVWLNPPLAVCLERNRHRSRQVPEAVIYRMHRQLWGAPPRLREGMDQLQYIATPGLQYD
ncbi:MAG: AAA family ATPase [Elainella sp. Prado103]|nr:AAA family ATPase [Elainella sp. Prado103]